MASANLRKCSASCSNCMSHDFRSPHECKCTRVQQIETFTCRPQVMPYSLTPQNLGELGLTCGLYLNMNKWVEVSWMRGGNTQPAPSWSLAPA